METYRNVQEKSMTGAYMRVKRDGKWQSIEIEYLTDEERSAAFKNKDSKECYRWVCMLCEELAKAEEILISLEEDSILERTKEV